AENAIIISPIHKIKRPTPTGHRETLGASFPDILFEIRDAFSQYILLRPINLREVRVPRLVRRERMLTEDATNLSNVLHTWLIDRGGKLPERLEAALSALFPKMRIGLELTSDGRVFLKIYENEVEIHPPCISDGLYKILAILMAIESRPSLLAIDEIENSLHAKTLEYIIDELRNSGTTVIITTHSAIVADIVRPEELLIAEKGPEGTTLNRIKKPEQVREKMKHLGITQSEMWLYGKLE
ncbi:MAG: AAA family ATPase, partial [Nitrososphaerales archaeon]